MPVKMRRRRVKKKRRPGEISKVKFTVFIAIMVLAVFLGYLTAKFVIGPLLGYNADESPIKITGQEQKDDDKDESKDKEKEASSDKGAEESSGETEKAEEGYALQFGVFSTKEAANELSVSLSEKGIETKIVEDDGMFKVISPVIKTKDEAIDQLNDIKDKEVEDVFIASF